MHRLGLLSRPPAGYLRPAPNSAEERAENFDSAQFQKLSQEPRGRIILDPSLVRMKGGMLVRAFLAHRRDYIVTNKAIVYQKISRPLMAGMLFLVRRTSLSTEKMD
ncbi:MAG: hypothetical protein QOH31_762 [Verrucomicrobiota bacterium]|jgi:hypothetical protein